ncbi:MAG: hypothetical protein H0Z24_03090 [Thermosipho sp. (in: Bacteria)]|nr:hypothetical protein [Thermosipho sp. (in: thermotogales)]
MANANKHARQYKKPFALIPRQLLNSREFLLLTKNALAVYIILSSIADTNGIICKLNRAALARAYNMPYSNFYEGFHTLIATGFIAADSHNVILLKHKTYITDKKGKKKGFVKIPLGVLKGTNFTGVTLRALKILIYFMSINAHTEKEGNVYNVQKIMLATGINRPWKIKKAIQELSYILSFKFFDTKGVFIKFDSQARKETYTSGKYYSEYFKGSKSYFDYNDETYKTLAIWARQYGQPLVIQALKETIKRRFSIQQNFIAYMKGLIENLWILKSGLKTT